MLKKAITFEDLDGNQVTETFYFKLSKAELAEMQLSAPGGSLENMLREIVADNDGGKIIEAFKMIISKAIGRRSSNNRSFEKSSEITQEFMQSDAYSELFVELISDAKAAAEFINACIPANFEGSNATNIQDVPMPPAIDITRAQAAIAKPVVKSTAELDPSNMTREQLQTAFEKFRRQAESQ